MPQSALDDAPGRRILSERRAGGYAGPSMLDQPLPRVEPAFDFAGLLDELAARVLPARLSCVFEGFAEDDFAMMCFLSHEGDRPRASGEVA